MNTIHFKEVEIEPGGDSADYVQYISLKTDGKNRFLLTWELPITIAYLVMVDETILRIDARKEKSIHTFSVFPVGHNYSAILKMGTWNKKRIRDISECSCLYDFNINDKPDYEVSEPDKSSNTRSIHFSDHLEMTLAEALDEVGIKFVHESENKDQRLDFYLPFYDVYIEVKQFHTDRIASQMSFNDNVIAVQGIKSVELLVKMLLKSKK